MPIYNYKGRDTGGKLLTGKIEAVEEAGAARQLLGAGITPVDLSLETPEELRQEARRGRFIFKPAVRHQELLLFTRQMRAMVKAGVPMSQILSSIASTTAQARLSHAVHDLGNWLEKGTALSVAMGRHPDIFNAYYVNMVKVGEETGTLDESFARLFEQLQFDHDMKQRIRTALRYPSFVVGAIVVAMAIVTVFVIPTFATLFSSMNMELPLLTRVLLASSELVRQQGWVMLLLLLAAPYGLRMQLRRPGPRLHWDRVKLRLPIVGSIIRKASLARFCRSFATALRSGVPIVLIFEMVARVVDNAHYAQRILEMRAGVERGESLLRVARAAGMFDPVELQMIAVGEQTGGIDDMLFQVADIYQQEVEYEASRLSASIEPLLLVVLGLLVGILMLGIFEPMWSMTQMARRGG